MSKVMVVVVFVLFFVLIACDDGDSVFVPKAPSEPQPAPTSFDRRDPHNWDWSKRDDGGGDESDTY